MGIRKKRRLFPSFKIAPLKNQTYPKVWFFSLIILGTLLCLTSISQAYGDTKVSVFGSNIYDDETILKMAGLDANRELQVEEIKQRLETTGYFSRVAVIKAKNSLTIILREKTPWFLLPYLSTGAGKNVYGLAGGLMGIGRDDAMLIGRAQFGTGDKEIAILLRDDFFLGSLWIMGGSADYEIADHDVYVGRSLKERIPNEHLDFSQQTGYHLTRNLFLEFDSHIESHRFQIPEQSGMQFSHRVILDYGNYFLNEGLARGFNLKPYFETTAPWSYFKLCQWGILTKKSIYLEGDFNWISRWQWEHGNSLPFYQRFELGGYSLRGFAQQTFRTDSYTVLQNDFLLASWNVWKLKVRPMVFADFAYLENEGHSGIGAGLQVYFRQVAMPAIQVYGGYGFHPNGFSIIAAIGPHI